MYLVLFSVESFSSMIAMATNFPVTIRKEQTCVMYHNIKEGAKKINRVYNNRIPFNVSLLKIPGKKIPEPFKELNE